MKTNKLEKKPLKITFLGTGTSQGVPIIGCDCEVCSSCDSKDKRLRTSLLISSGSVNIVIDTGPDFRQQMLRAGVKDLKAVLLTHSHNDHVAGLDDVRPFNFKEFTNMPLYATLDVQTDLKKRFAYIFEENPYPGAPMISLKTISKRHPFQVEGIYFTPIEVMHGNLPILGFRVGNFTYLTDVKTIEETERKKIRGTQVLVLNALHHSEHHSHLNLSEALAMIEDLSPGHTYLIHASHRMGLHGEVSKKLPPHVSLAYDGLEIWV
ncbi:MAG: MBL fold metallo-hydrolase [Saprospiraceae bacterium]